MPRIKLPKAERAQRRRMQQRNYYLKKKAQRKGRQDLIPKAPDFILSAEVIQKNWVRIQRFVFSEDVLNYFVQLYQSKYMKRVSEDRSSFSAKKCSESLYNQKIIVESKHDINGAS